MPKKESNSTKNKTDDLKITIFDEVFDFEKLREIEQDIVVFLDGFKPASLKISY